MNGDSGPGREEIQEIMREFLLEGREIVDRLDRDLVQLEKTPDDAELLAGVFRGVHTLKGNSSFIGLPRLEAVTHAAENLLSLLRESKATLNPDMVGALLKTVDAIRETLEAIEATGTESDEDWSALIGRLGTLAKGDAPAKSAAPEKGTSSSETGIRAPVHADTNIRVDVGLLDKLMSLVGELVLSRNQLLQTIKLGTDTPQSRAVHRLNLVTSELQEGVMKARMQALGTLWNRFPRVVRDLAHACGKTVSFEMRGTETELDRTIIEAIRDPLIHLLRNSIDHGIEPAHRRRAAGKPEQGAIMLRASHEGGQVLVELSDDGQGIDVARIRARILKLGLATPQELDRLDDADVFRFIFQRGFSTTDTVTNLSGRGVGLDVVKENIEKIGGAVDVKSVPGRGTTFTMKIPLTLAIVPALIVDVEGESYAIPQVSVLELVRVEKGKDEGRLEMFQNVPVYRLRGKLLPLVFLDRILRPEKPALDEAAAAQIETCTIVVLQVTGENRFGLVVDEVKDTEEIVVKPLGNRLKTLSIFSGATFLADGRVALILDVIGVADRARVISKARSLPGEDESSRPRPADEAKEAFLLLRGPDDGRMAVPLAEVTRLEEIEIDAVERVGSRDVVQYRGEILPLVDLAATLPERRKRPRAADRETRGPRERLKVVVYRRGSRHVGLIVDGILDTVEERLSQERPSSRPGVLRCAVIRERITELLDVEGILQQAGVGRVEGDAAPGARDS